MFTLLQKFDVGLKWISLYLERETERDRERQRERGDRETERERDRERERGDRDTETQRHRDTETQRHRDTETQRHRETEMEPFNRSTMIILFLKYSNLKPREEEEEEFIQNRTRAGARFLTRWD